VSARDVARWHGSRRTWPRRSGLRRRINQETIEDEAVLSRRAACCTPRAWPSKPTRASVCGPRRARWIGRAGPCAETTRKRRSSFGVPCAPDVGRWSTVLIRWSPLSHRTPESAAPAEPARAVATRGDCGRFRRLGSRTGDRLYLGLSPSSVATHLSAALASSACGHGRACGDVVWPADRQPSRPTVNATRPQALEGSRHARPRAPNGLTMP